MHFFSFYPKPENNQYQQLAQFNFKKNLEKNFDNKPYYKTTLLASEFDQRKREIENAPYFGPE
jgi:hypothetical protein